MSQLVLVQGTALHLPLKDASVHCCVTSPPYYGLRSYGIGEGELGLEPTLEAYVAALMQVFREVKRVLHPTGVMFINMGDSYQDKQLQGIPWKVAFALQQDNWILRSDCIWDKPSCMPESVQDRPTRSHEYVFLFSKQARYFYDAEAVKEATDMAYLLSRNPHGRAQNATAKNTIPGQGIKNNSSFNAAVTEALPYRNMRTVWRIASEPTGFQHYAAFPTALVRRCLLAGAPSQVCSQCGAPWKREVERGPLLDQRSHPGQPAHLSPQGYLRNGKSRCGINETVAVGDWFPTCPCAAGTAPSVVLDPFAGSGTTLLVARELGHHAVGVDLSYPYLRDIARERLGLADLARWEGRTGDAPAMDYSALPLFSGGAS